jgi:UDPglucose 6-dehydrogenase
MKITIIGTGYVGLVTGTCLAETGHDVTCVDIDKEKIARLKKGETPIFEPGLIELVQKNQQAGRLQFTTDYTDIDDPEVIFFALPTPPGGDGEADLTYVIAAAKDVAARLKTYTVLVNKSTVPVGTAQKVRDIIAGQTKVPFDVVSNPEFLREGLAIDDFLNADRIVVGTSSAKARAVMQEVYHPFTNEGVELLIMDEASAEMTKYAANSFLAAKISFMNEIANLCEKVGANVDLVKEGIGKDARIGMKFLNAGIGYGGSCFPKDVMALERVAANHDYEFKMLRAVMDVNDRQKTVLIDKIKKHFGNDLTGLRFAMWGLAFKPDTDDIREAPSLLLIKHLLEAGAQVIAYDPEASANVKRIVGDSITFAATAHDALEDTDALLLVTEWKEFAGFDPDHLAKKLRKKIVFDGRNLFEPATMAKAGLTHVSIGRKTVGHHG